MRTTNHTARGIPLAVLLLTLACLSWAVMGEGTLRIDQAISPNEIYTVGADDEEPTSAVLTLSIGVMGPVVRYPIDCMFVIDVSATSDLVQAREFAYDLIDQLGVDDRVGLVSYGTTARLDMPLTHNLGAVRLAIADLAASGKSAMGLAMQVARREFDQIGREDALFVEILITDGQSSVGVNPDGEGEAAAQLGIKIVCVGLGTLINRNLLETFAEQTDGQFFQSPSDRARTEIINGLDVYVAARDVRIEKRLPAELRMIDASPDATQVELHSDGTTTAIWRLADLELGDSTSIQMELEAVLEGEWETDVSSTVRFVDFRGVRQVIEIPHLLLTAIEPNWPPSASFVVATDAPLGVGSLVSFEDTSVDDVEVVAWEWDFDDGTTSVEQDPEHRFTEEGTFAVSLVAIDEEGETSEPYSMDVTIDPNQPPTSSFLIEVGDVVDTVEAVLFEDTSVDADGEVVAWEWDFGDGTVSYEQNPEHRFHDTGTFTVSLVAIDASGEESEPYEANVIVELGPRVAATRTIETCLPGDQTIPGSTVGVVLVIDIRGMLNGLAVVETFPPGWTFIEGENDGATLRQSGNTAEWLFIEQLVGENFNTQREIRYQLQAPPAAATGGAGLAQASIGGSLGSSSPRFEQPVLGEDKLTVTEFLPIPIVISRWDTDSNELDLCEPDPEVIDFAEIQYAISLWLSGTVVPQTSNLTIDIAMMQELIGYWLTGRSVHDSLP